MTKGRNIAISKWFVSFTYKEYFSSNRNKKFSRKKCNACQEAYIIYVKERMQMTSKCM